METRAAAWKQQPGFGCSLKQVFPVANNIAAWFRFSDREGEVLISQHFYFYFFFFECPLGYDTFIWKSKGKDSEVTSRKIAPKFWLFFSSGCCRILLFWTFILFMCNCFMYVTILRNPYALLLNASHTVLFTKNVLYIASNG